MPTTTGNYAGQHAGAHAQVAAKGAAVTFTKGATTVAGVALRIPGKPRTYQALNLIESEAPSILFVADTYGDDVPLGATGTFGGIKYSVRNVDPLAPDGVTITATLVVAR